MNKFMLRSAGVFGVCAALCVAASAWAGPAKAVKTKPPAGYTRMVVLWPNGAPGAVGTEDGDVPKLFVYPAVEPEPRGAGRKKDRKGAELHSAVIVMPGGGYTNLVTEKEGGAAARWLSAHGVTAFVLEYRLGKRYHYPAPMQDGARALRYVRSHAAEFEVAKDKIGLWGFSAGGHLAGYLATTYDEGEKASADPVERVGDRPDFVVLSYGRLSMDPAIPRETNLEGLLGDHPTEEAMQSMSLERRVRAGMPPCLIYSTNADKTVNALTATAFYDALKRAGVPAELHIFERGPHGTGMGIGLATLPELSTFSALLANWMEIHGWMTDPEEKVSK